MRKLIVSYCMHSREVAKVLVWRDQPVRVTVLFQRIVIVWEAKQ